MASIPLNTFDVVSSSGPSEERASKYIGSAGQQLMNLTETYMIHRRDQTKSLYC
jgi:hypothetical protein